MRYYVRNVFFKPLSLSRPRQPQLCVFRSGRKKSKFGPAPPKYLLFRIHSRKFYENVKEKICSQISLSWQKTAISIIRHFFLKISSSQISTAVPLAFRGNRMPPKKTGNISGSLGGLVMNMVCVSFCRRNKVGVYFSVRHSSIDCSKCVNDV